MFAILLTLEKQLKLFSKIEFENAIVMGSTSEREMSLPIFLWVCYSLFSISGIDNIKLIFLLRLFMYMLIILNISMLLFV